VGNSLQKSQGMNKFYSDRESKKLEENVRRLVSNQVTQPIQKQELPKNEPEYSVKFNKHELHKGNLKEWIDELVQDKFERASKLELPIREQADAESRSKDRHRSKSSKSSRGRSIERKSSKESFKSFKSNASKLSFESVRSTAKSVKSVLFKNVEEEDLRSQISDDDIADINAGDTSFVDYAYDKFTIHGPFVDKELNVFHSICNEYSLASRFTFAKRNKFTRTNPAHERVYALIGSDKRSSWTNRNDWTQAINNLRVLDFIFRRVIRSRSRIIKEPVMVLEHFTHGSVLDSRRFKCVIRSIFKKRDHLMEVLGIEMIKFEDIK